MQTYKVIGRKYQDYYTKVEAADPNAAYEVADSLDTSKWFKLPDDDVIEPIDVFEEISEEIQLNKDIDDDEWPDMNPGILIEGK